jgi:dihydrofolate reductase
VTAARELKEQDGRALILYGHGRLSQTLLEHHLLDEIRFAVHPLLLAGRTAGHDNEPTPKLKLIAATPLPTGVVALCYQPDHTETG